MARLSTPRMELSPYSFQLVPEGKSQSRYTLKKQNPEFFDENGNFKDPRTKIEKFEACIWSVIQGNKRTIVKYDPVRICMKNIYGVELPMSDEEISTKIRSIKASKKYRRYRKDEAPVQADLVIAISEGQARALFG